MAFTLSGDAATTRTNLGLGDAATKTTGTAAGNIPVLDSSGKIADAQIAALAASKLTGIKTVGGVSIAGSGDIATLPSGGTADQVLTSDASGTGTWEDAAGGGGTLQMKAVVDGTDRTSGADSTTPSGGYNWSEMTITMTPAAATSYFKLDFMLSIWSVGSYMSGGWFTWSSSSNSERACFQSASGHAGGRDLTFRCDGIGSSNSDMPGPVGGSMLFHPNTTETITVRIRTFAAQSGYPLNHNRPGDGRTDADDGSRPISTLILSEISGDISPSVSTNSTVRTNSNA